MVQQKSIQINSVDIILPKFDVIISFYTINFSSKTELMNIVTKTVALALLMIHSSSVQLHAIASQNEGETKTSSMSFRDLIVSIAMNSSIASSFSQANRLAKKEKAIEEKRIGENYHVCRTIAEVGLSVSDDCYNNEDVIDSEDDAVSISEESSE